MMYGKGGSKMPKSVYKKGGSKMAGLKAMYKSLSPEQKKEMMSARYGMEKPLNQMGDGGMLDMSVPMQMKMRYGGDMMKKMKAMQMGGEGSDRPLPGNPPERLRPRGLKPDPNPPMSERASKILKKKAKSVVSETKPGSGKKRKPKRAAMRYGGGTASTYSGPKKRKK